MTIVGIALVDSKIFWRGTPFNHGCMLCFCGWLRLAEEERKERTAGGIACILKERTVLLYGYEALQLMNSQPGQHAGQRREGHVTLITKALPLIIIHNLET